MIYSLEGMGTWTANYIVDKADVTEHNSPPSR